MIRLPRPPMQSPRRQLAGAGARRGTVAAVVSVSAAALVVSCSAGTSPRPSSPMTAPVATGTSTAIPPRAVSDLRMDPWVDVAVGFGRTFTATTLGQDAWFASVSTWLSDEQAALYRDIPVDNIPAGRLIAVEADQPVGGATRGLLIYDTGMVLDIALEYVGSRGSWLVVSIVPGTAR